MITVTSTAAALIENPAAISTGKLALVIFYLYLSLL